MRAYSVHDLVTESQTLNVSRYSLPPNSLVHPGSDLSLWASRRVAITVALCMLNGAMNGVSVTLNCPSIEA